VNEPALSPADVILPAPPAGGFDDIGTGLTLNADVAVVGTGPGGSALARVLAEGGMSVVLLEEGPKQSRFAKNQADTCRNHMIDGGTLLARGRNFMPIAAGRGVGGGSLINSALSFRTPDAVLDGWADLLDDAGWSAAAMAPIYDEVAALIGVGITPDRVAGANNRLIVRGARALGLEGGLAPRSTPGCTGCGVCNFGCPTNGKGSANVTMLPRAVAAGARIQAEARVEAILAEGNRAVGVRGQAVHPDTHELGGTVEVRAPRVVLSAGAIGTPRLLWSTGLAPQLGPVGDGLHVHPGNAVLGLAEEVIHLWRGATQGAYFHHPDLPGVLPHSFSAPPEACLLAMNRTGNQLAQGLAELPHLAGCVVMVSDKANGRVRATPDGRVQVDYDFSDEDLDRTRRGMVEAARVMLAAGVVELFAPVHGLGRHHNLASFEAALRPRTLRDFTLYAAHPMATCRMGRDRDQSVVDTDGRAHGLPGLWIADASVFPTSLGVNPQLTVYATATRIARRMLEAG
jgi:choline dehydrogenase-like flavoprotein